jgi:hypothetical protein
MKPLSLCFLLAATRCPAADLVSAQPVLRQPPAGYASAYDPRQLAAITPTISRCTWTGALRHRRADSGDRSGTPVRPQLSQQPVYAVGPDGAITLHGLKAHSIAFLAATSITNDASDQSAVDRGPGFGQVRSGLVRRTQPISVQVASRFGVIGHIEGSGVAGERALSLLSYLSREVGEYE